MFFRRRPFFYMRRPWLRRRFYYRRWGCFPGCFTLVLLGLLAAAALAILF